MRRKFRAFTGAGLMPDHVCTYPGTRELTVAACTFGNTLTLPLVFMMSLLPGAAFDRAVGYTALFLVGWSPLLWSLGYWQLSTAGFHPDQDSK